MQGLHVHLAEGFGIDFIAHLDQQGQVLPGAKASVETKNMERELSSETQILLFRIAQEALNNIRKHAKASIVNIRLEGREKDIEMTVTDDGQGFEAPGKIEGMVSAGRLGLMGMHERAGLLNGTLQIKSSPGKGTELKVNIPWPVIK